MVEALTEAALVSALKKGVARSSDLIARITQYHGGPVTTEYMLTSDIARELIDQKFEVEVEYANRRMVNGMTMGRSGPSLPKLGSRRTDVAVFQAGRIAALAMIEVKIGVASLGGIKSDLEKMILTISGMKPEYAAHIWGAAVFQVHVKGTSFRTRTDQFSKAVVKVEERIRTDLAAFARTQPTFKFVMHPLQEEGGGIMPLDVAFDGDEFLAYQDGHATRYHAVLLKSSVQSPPPPKTFVELKARSRA